MCNVTPFSTLPNKYIHSFQYRFKTLQTYSLYCLPYTSNTAPIFSNLIGLEKKLDEKNIHRRMCREFFFHIPIVLHLQNYLPFRETKMQILCMRENISHLQNKNSIILYASFYKSPFLHPFSYILYFSSLQTVLCPKPLSFFQHSSIRKSFQCHVFEKS